MIRMLAAILLLLISVVALRAQSEAQITSIRAEVNLINRSAPKYQKKTRAVEGVSLEGTEATYFLSGRGLKKITAKMYGETFRATVELFYSGDEVIFAFQRVERYDTHIAMKPPPKVAKIIETRVYYAGGEAIRVIEGKKQLVPSDEKFPQAAKEMKELSDELKKALER
jgi:hypothetical protein